MRYCPQCGSSLSRIIPVDDDRPREVCDNCAMVHYQNPKMVVGTVPLFESEILLCRRAIEPCRGLWTLPAGYLENGETVAEGARRETLEEARAELGDLEPYLLLNLPFINQMYFMFLANLPTREFAPGRESLEIRLFPVTDLPWDELAFAVIRRTLEIYCSDFPQGPFPFRVVDIDPEKAKSCS
jgi:ADP-ribose pyrophosphatase YjhB (NUDIX family)